MVPVFEKLKEECREEGRMEGRVEGKESSISLFIRNFRALNNSDDSIVELLMKGTWQEIRITDTWAQVEANTQSYEAGAGTGTVHYWRRTA